MIYFAKIHYETKRSAVHPYKIFLCETLCILLANLCVIILKAYFCFQNLPQMDATKIIEILAYTIPSIITGGMAYYLFNLHFKDQQNTRRWLIQKDNQKMALPLRLQAYERLTLLMERINPSQLMVRINPISNDKNDYENYVIAQIEQEFEHNIAQQIYVSDKCWTIIITAKNATVQMVRTAAKNEKVTNADELRTYVISELFDKSSPSNTALSFIKSEVAELW